MAGIETLIGDTPGQTRRRVAGEPVTPQDSQREPARTHSLAPGGVAPVEPVERRDLPPPSAYIAPSGRAAPRHLKDQSHSVDSIFLEHRSQVRSDHQIDQSRIHPSQAKRNFAAELDSLDGEPQAIDLERIGLGSAARSLAEGMRPDPRETIAMARKSIDSEVPRSPEVVIEHLDQAVENALQLSGMAGRETFRQRIDRSKRRAEVISILPGHRGLMGESWGMMSPEQQQAWLKGARADVNGKLALLHEQRLKAEDAVKAFRRTAPDAPLHPWLQEQQERSVKALADAERREREIAEMEAGRLDPASKTVLRSGVENAAQGLAHIASGILKGTAIGAAYLSNFPGNLTKDTIIDTKHAGRIKPDENLVHSLGRWIDAKSRQFFPGDNARREEFSQKLAQGAGSMMGFYGPGVVGKIMGASDKALVRLVATTGAFVEGSQTFADAQRSADAGRPVSVNEQYFAYLGGLVLGVTEAAPFERFMRGGKGGMGRHIGEQAVSESLQEGGQTLGENVLAKYIHDPNREIFSGVGEAGLIGGILGGTMKIGQFVISPGARAEARTGAQRIPTADARSAAVPEVDVAERLTWLDKDQLVQLNTALRRNVGDDADEKTLRKSIADYVDEYAGEAAEEAANDAQAGRAAGRMEAFGFIEEELAKLQPNETQAFRALIAGTTPKSRWRKEMGVSGTRIEELIDDAVKDGLLAIDSNGVMRRVALGEDANKRANMIREQATWARARQIAGWAKTDPEKFEAAEKEMETLIDRLTKHMAPESEAATIAAHTVPKQGSRAAKKAEAEDLRNRRFHAHSAAFEIIVEDDLDIKPKGSGEATLRFYLGQLDDEQLSRVADAADIDLPRAGGVEGKRKALLKALDIAEGKH